MSSPDAQNLPEDVARSGMALVIVPLIIGAAVVISLIVMWNARESKLQLTETTRVVEEIRTDLNHAYHELRDNRPDLALATVGEIELKMKRLKVDWVADYLDITAAPRLMKGEALFRIDSVKNARDAEAAFDSALAVMTHASGELWIYGLLGRGRTRYQLGNYAGAESDFTMLLDRNPSFGTAYFWRAHARRRLGDVQGAQADEEKAEALDSWPPLRSFVMSSEEQPTAKLLF